MASGVGTSTYSYALGMEDMAKKKHAWLRLPVAETSGSIYAVKAIEKSKALWYNTIDGLSLEMIYQMEKPMSPFDTQIMGFVPLFVYNGSAAWLMTTDPNIKTMKDLVGKKISLGTAAHISWTVMPEYLIKYGLDYGKDIQIMYSTPAQAMQALLDGTVAAAITQVYLNLVTNDIEPAPDLLSAFATGRKLYYIGFPEEAFPNLKKATGWTIAPKILPAGSQPQLDHDLVTRAALNTMCSKDVFPEELAYEVTKFWIENCQYLKEYDALGRLVTKEQMPMANLIYRLHPGAKRAFDEAKIPIPQPK